MKTFINRATGIKVPNEKGDGVIHWNFANLALSCLNSLPENNRLPLSEQRNRLRVIDYFEDVKTQTGISIELEEADFNKLYELVLYMEDKWGFMHKDLVIFHDYIVDLSKTNEKAKEIVTEEE